jgi:hypothetical protein
VLSGKLEVTTFDLVQQTPTGDLPDGTLVDVAGCHSLSLDRSSGVSHFTPTLRNVHAMTCTGQEVCVMVDVMMPR